MHEGVEIITRIGERGFLQVAIHLVLNRFDFDPYAGLAPVALNLVGVVNGGLMNPIPSRLRFILQGPLLRVASLEFAQLVKQLLLVAKAAILLDLVKRQQIATQAGQASE
ncbi:hypothetical protein ABT389_21800 [Streptomyces bacillaris]|uniref:hypothetical protein n=1 Tax=Streptomyces bacillaris TaxID=68179 RepID=UPI003346F87E